MYRTYLYLIVVFFFSEMTYAQNMETRIKRVDSQGEILKTDDLLYQTLFDKF